MKTIVGYMCKVDYECELGRAPGGVSIYASIEDLKEHRSCAEECGIVEVEVTFSKVIQKGRYD